MPVSTMSTNDKLLRPDGPWAFVVCGAAFCDQVITGFSTCSGIYYVHFQEAFQSSATATSWLCSMAFVGIFLGSIFGGPMSRLLGDRLCCFVGGLISSTGFALCMLSSNFYLLFFLYGILGCIGSGIHFVGFINAVNKYFDKYIHSAQVFLAIGSSTGVSIASVLLPHLLQTYGWKGTLLIQAGMSFNVCAFSCVLYLKNTPTTGTKSGFQFSKVLSRDIVLFSFHSLLCILSESAIYVHLPVLLEQKHYSERYSSLSLLVLGLSVIVAKLVYTIQCRVNVLVLYTLTFFVGGVTAIFLPFGNNIYVIYACTVLMGFSLSVLGGLTILVILELTDREDFIDATVISFLFRAFGSIIAGPLCGLAYDFTGDYSYAFYLAGTSIVLACILMIPSIITSVTKRRQPDHVIDSHKAMVPLNDGLSSRT